MNDLNENPPLLFEPGQLFIVQNHNFTAWQRWYSPNASLNHLSLELQKHVPNVDDVIMYLGFEFQPFILKTDGHSKGSKLFWKFLANEKLIYAYLACSSYKPNRITVLEKEQLLRKGMALALECLKPVNLTNKD